MTAIRVSGIVRVRSMVEQYVRGAEMTVTVARLRCRSTCLSVTIWKLRMSVRVG